MGVHRPRPHRLSTFDYLGQARYFVTCCTYCRCRVLSDAAMAEMVLAQFRAQAATEGMAILAYCAMPDHVHLVLEAQAVHSDLQRFMRRAKQAAGYRFRCLRGERLWQDGYFDRVLRGGEESTAVMRYVLENPVRGGLAKRVGEYPHAGSDVFRIEELLTAWERFECTRLKSVQHTTEVVCHEEGTGYAPAFGETECTRLKSCATKRDPERDVAQDFSPVPAAHLGSTRLRPARA